NQVLSTATHSSKKPPTCARCVRVRRSTVTVLADMRTQAHDRVPSRNTTYETRYMMLQPPTNAMINVLSHRTTMPAVFTSGGNAGAWDRDRLQHAAQYRAGLHASNPCRRIHDDPVGQNGLHQHLDVVWNHIVPTGQQSGRLGGAEQ